MSTLRFTDGLVVDTKGPLRIQRLKDGYYVIGRGMMIPINSRNEGYDIINSMKEEER